jgi:hypothetical protein
LDLLVLAKREAARRELYSRFYRGDVVHQKERVDPLDSTGKVPKGTVERDNKCQTGVDPPGKESRREKRKRKEERKVTRESRKKIKAESEREKGQS